MAVLNDWQKITRVLPGKPFGDGSDGDYSSATIPTLTKDSCSGTATSTTLTTSGSTFANGDVLLIHQTRGTGVGQWEVNRVVSGGGSTSLTLQEALHYTYTDSGASQAQATKILLYNNVTVQSGTWTIPAWDGNVGGILTLSVKGTMTVTGNINAEGSAPTVVGGGGGQTSPSNGGGFRGGWSDDGINSFGLQGEASTGAGSQSSSANNTGGGAGGGNSNFNAGGGGSHATSGTSATGSGSTNGSGATSTSGSADLTSMTFGGGGGGATGIAGSTTGSASNGGGIVAIFAKGITLSGVISADGGDGGGSARVVGGGGAGGSVLIACETATLGTNKITAIGGVIVTNGTENAGDGGNGRIALHYATSYTGTTNPTLTATQDTTLVEAAEFSGGIIII